MVYIDISPLSDGLNEVVVNPSAEDLGLDPSLFADIVTRVRLDVGSRQVVCGIEASAKADLVCDRTLEPYVEAIEGDHTVVFTDDPDEIAEFDDEMFLLDPKTSRIDITEVVRDTLLLSIPLRKVAPSARGKEIDLAFGEPEETGDGIDPRWDALRALKTDV